MTKATSSKAVSPKLSQPKPRLAKLRPARRNETKRRGEFAELVFQLAAILRGFKVSKPHGDSDRYDFILDTGTRLWRVQVKSTSNFHEGLYHVNSGRRLNQRAVPYKENQIDFLVVYVVPEETWYIIPVADLEHRVSLLLYPKNNPKPGLYGKFREAWHLFQTT